MCSLPNIIGTFVVLSMWIDHYPSALSIIDIPQYFMKPFLTILFKVYFIIYIKDVSFHVIRLHMIDNFLYKSYFVISHRTKLTKQQF